MKGLAQFRKLTPKEQALICIAVLFDGLDGPDVLATDAENGAVLKKLSREVASLAPDVRMPLMGTLLRGLMMDREEDS